VIKILVFSFYYEPDLCAGSFRCTSLINALKTLRDVEIEVITTQPNRYASFSAEAGECEKNGNVTVNRVSLPSHKSGILDQIRAFTTFYRYALKISMKSEHDLVFATSSRLFTAFLGSRIARLKKVPLYLDIRDIFVDTVNELLPTNVAWLVKPFFSMVERYTFDQAKRINLVSRGFSGYFQKRYPSADLRWFTNGIDSEFLSGLPTLTSSGSGRSKLTVLYAGNIGDGQGLHNIVPQLAKKLDLRVNFRLLGDGGRKSLLQSKINTIPNVVLLPPVSRAELIREYQDADILFLHLNDFEAFRKVLPSKIFEYAALGKPIWAGVAGFPATFLQKEVVNSVVFHPGNVEQALTCFDELDFFDIPRPEFVEKYDREKINTAMALDIVDLMNYGND
jgi:hypothetical protein